VLRLPFGGIRFAYAASMIPDAKRSLREFTCDERGGVTLEYLLVAMTIGLTTRAAGWLCAQAGESVAQTS